MTKMTLTKRGGFRVAVLAAIFLLSFSSLPAQVLIKGKITDKNGAGLIGASIALQDTRFGGFTDLDGNYSFEAVVDPGPYVLVVTSVGYRTVSMNISITGNQVEQNFQVEEDILSLDEVVVTGTVANTAKKELGNSISSLSSKDLANANAVSIDGALQGKISGAQVTQNSGNPAGGITVRLRGPSTIVGSSDPLFIVDGVIVNNDSRQLIDLGGYAQNRLVDINPNDIERIEIIKGAAAAAIYGSRDGRRARAPRLASRVQGVRANLELCRRRPTVAVVRVLPAEQAGRTPGRPRRGDDAEPAGVPGHAAGHHARRRGAGERESAVHAARTRAPAQ